MGYAVYEQHVKGTTRWAGYGVPAECDMVDCHEQIDRGLAYKCDLYYEYDDDGVEETELEFEGCELFFCGTHEGHSIHGDDVLPKGESVEWVRHVLSDETWEQWRSENPETVTEYESMLR